MDFGYAIVTFRSLTLDDYFAADNQVYPQRRSQLVALIVDGQFDLAGYWQSCLAQLPSQHLLVHAFQKAGPAESTVDFQSAIDNFAADFILIHGMRLNAKTQWRKDAMS